jgi:hypothetical protein
MKRHRLLHGMTQQYAYSHQVIRLAKYIAKVRRFITQPTVLGAIVFSYQF